MEELEAARKYLIANGYDPDEIGRQGRIFVETLIAKIELQNKVKEMYSKDDVIKICNSLYSALTTDSTYDGVWLDEWFEKNKL